MRYPMPARGKAFTLVEFPIVLTILAVGAGLALVGLQNLRVASQRNQCTDNLRQIGIAIYAYVDVYKKVPPAWNPDAGRLVREAEWTIKTGAGWCNSSPPLTGMAAGPNILGTIHYIILPFIEEDPLYKTSCPNGSNTPPFVGTAAAGTVIPLYLCTSDPSLDNNVQESDQPGVAGGLASCNYAANLMVFDPKGTGNIIQAMPRGSSNTVMWTERARKCATNNPLHPFAEPAWANYPGYGGPRQGQTSYAAPSGKAILYDVPVFGVNEYFLDQTAAASGSSYAGATNFTSYVDSTACPSTATVEPTGWITWDVNSGPGSAMGFQIARSAIQYACNANVVQGSHARSIPCLMGDGSIHSYNIGTPTRIWLHDCLPNDWNEEIDRGWREW